MPKEAPLLTLWNGSKWKAWSRVQATHCFRSGKAGIADKLSQGRTGRDGMRLIPEEFALHSVRIPVEMKLAAGGARDAVIQRNGRWASKPFMEYVRANIEDRFRCRNY